MNYSIKNKQDRAELTVVSPGVSADGFDIELDFGKLVITAHLLNEDEGIKKPAVIPLSKKVFNLPAFVDISNIEAVHEDGVLKVILPYTHTSENMKRKINIRDFD